MKRSVTLSMTPLLAALLAANPGAASAASSSPAVQLTYRGGPLIQHAQVLTLFWGPSWKNGSLVSYFNAFFQALFADGRYMANLAQYSAGGYQIGNGSFGGTVTDSQAPPARLLDAQVQAEIRAQIAAGQLPKATADSIYFVFTPPGVEVFDRYGNNSINDFVTYNDYAFGSDGFAYVVIPYDDTLPDPRQMTEYASEELADAVTDPEVTGAKNQVGWYDDNYGEVGEIPYDLFSDNQIDASKLTDQLTATDGTVYSVETVWSNKANAPVAFAPASGG